MQHAFGLRAEGARLLVVFPSFLFHGFAQLAKGILRRLRVAESMVRHRQDYDRAAQASGRIPCLRGSSLPAAAVAAQHGPGGAAGVLYAALLRGTPSASFLGVNHNQVESVRTNEVHKAIPPAVGSNPDWDVELHLVKTAADRGIKNDMNDR